MVRANQERLQVAEDTVDMRKDLVSIRWVFEHE